MDEQKEVVKDQVPQEPVKDATKPPIMKRFPKGGVKSKGNALIIFGSVFVVLLGLGTGWFLSGSKAVTSSGDGMVNEEQKKVETGDGVVELGEAGEEADEAEGQLEEGGVEGEGTYRLERDGGSARTVCLTSTAIDLSGFVGKKVKVWGETISPISCPWLMDVVKITESE